MECTVPIFQEKTMFQTGKKRHLNGQDVYCQGSQGFLKPTQIWKNNFQSSSKRKISNQTTPFPYVYSNMH